MTRDLGRHVYGAAAIAYGMLTLYWHGVHTWPQLQALGNAPYHQYVGYIAAAAAIGGGIAIQLRQTAQLGAAVLGAFYLAFAVFYVPGIVRAPLIYDSWGNFFEQFSLFSGALVAYASVASVRASWAPRAAQVGRVFLGICVLSFALEQAFYLHATAGLVPKWIPPGQMFWAIFTTIALALAAVAIVSRRQALLASQLLTAMLLLFAILIWVPILFADPRRHFYWSESAETAAIAGAVWILADYLGGTDRAAIRRSSRV